MHRVLIITLSQNINIVMTEISTTSQLTVRTASIMTCLSELACGTLTSLIDTVSAVLQDTVINLHFTILSSEDSWTSAHVLT